MRNLLLAIILLIVAPVGNASEPADSCGAHRDSVAFDSLPWYKQLLENNFNINDKRIHYPKFPKFCVDVYNWGDRTFNTYDTTYVVGTGKNWKVITDSYNWMESYAMYFSRDSHLRILSNLYSDLGLYLCFMAVKVGYSGNMNAIADGVKSRRNTFNFNFTCALFSASVNYLKTTGGSRITYLGNHSDNYKFEDISQATFNASVYYFFNNRRYSQAAAYSFSKYQLKSAGTWVAGFNFSHQRIDMDFSSLPPEMINKLPGLLPQYSFHYADYGLLGGYAYNWVLKPRKWLVNVTAMPSVGYKHSYEGATDGRKNMVSTNGQLMLSGVYNFRSLFAALQANAEGHIYFAKGYTFFNSIESLSLVVGARF